MASGALGCPLVADELGGVLERHVVDQKRAVLDAVAPRVGVAGAFERESFIEEDPRLGDDARAAAPVIGTGQRFAIGGVGAVERVVKAAPAGVGGVERITRVGDGDDQLRAGHGRNLGVCVFGGDLEGVAFGDKVADLGQEGFVGLVVVRLIVVFLVPLVDLALKNGAGVQQFPVPGCQVVRHPAEALPEGVWVDAAAGQGFGFQKGGKFLVHLKAVAFDPITHVTCLPRSGRGTYVCKGILSRKQMRLRPNC